MMVLNLPFKALMFLTLMRPSLVLFLVLWLKLVIFFFNDTATTEIYTLSLHDALPIFSSVRPCTSCSSWTANSSWAPAGCARSEEHTSELQSQSNIVCRLLLEKKNLISPSLVLFLVLWLKLVHDFSQVRCRLALLPFLV